MEPTGYELLKIETKIDGLEKELSILFDDFRRPASPPAPAPPLLSSPFSPIIFLFLTLL